MDLLPFLIPTLPPKGGALYPGTHTQVPDLLTFSWLETHPVPEDLGEKPAAWQVGLDMCRGPCDGLNCGPQKDVEARIPSPCQYGLIWK